MSLIDDKSAAPDEWGPPDTPPFSASMMAPGDLAELRATAKPIITLLEPDTPAPVGDRVPCHLFMPEVEWPVPPTEVIRVAWAEADSLEHQGVDARFVWLVVLLTSIAFAVQGVRYATKEHRADRMSASSPAGQLEKK